MLNSLRCLGATYRTTEWYAHSRLDVAVCTDLPDAPACCLRYDGGLNTQLVVANLIRNYWAYAVIFCGHFPDGAEKFTVEEFENERPGEWYLRQMLGSANFNAGPVLAFVSGNLCYQIEHHLFPDLPSNRYAEIGVRVRALWQSFWTILKLALPDKLLRATSEDAPETNSELKFRVREGLRESFVDPATGKRRGLRTAMRELRAAS